MAAQVIGTAGSRAAARFPVTIGSHRICPGLVPVAPRAHFAGNLAAASAGAGRAASRRRLMATRAAAGGATLTSHDLLQRALDFENVLVKRDASALDSLLSPSVTLHKDSITLQDDLEGEHNVKQYYTGYLENYEEEHTPIDLALNEENRSVFVLSVETGIKPKNGGSSSSSAGVFKYIFDEQGKVTDIYFIRQPSGEELKRKVQGGSLGNMEGVSFEPRDLLNELAGETVVGGCLVDVTPADPARVKQVHDIAVQYSDLYASNEWPKDKGLFERLFEPEVATVDMLFGSETRGLENVASAIEAVSKNYESSDHQHDIAVTPDGNKAFIHWSNRGVIKQSAEEDARNNLKGFTVLKFAPAGNITHILGFRQPTSKERQEVFGK